MSFFSVSLCLCGESTFLPSRHYPPGSFLSETIYSQACSISSAIASRARAASRARIAASAAAWYRSPVPLDTRRWSGGRENRAPDKPERE